MRVLVVLSLAILGVTVEACSRCVYKSDNGTVLVTRSMDWVEDLGTNLWAYPAGMKRNGGTEGNTLEWTSNYGSVVASGYGFTVDGVNEKGLVANILYLAESDYPEAEGKPTLSLGLWAQYVLDSFANVTEAVEDSEQRNFVVETFILPNGYPATVHLSISDAEGDSAIFEYVDKKLQIHHSPEYKVMTNSPIYSEQLALAAKWKDVDGLKSLPGTIKPTDRFVRLTYYNTKLPRSTNTTYRHMVAGAISAIRVVSVPYGLEDPLLPNVASTRWRTLADSTNKVYYFDSATTPNVFWVPLRDLDLKPGSPAKYLDVEATDKTYSGNVAKHFTAKVPVQAAR